MIDTLLQAIQARLDRPKASKHATWRRWSPFLRYRPLLDMLERLSDADIDALEQNLENDHGSFAMHLSDAAGLLFVLGLLRRSGFGMGKEGFEGVPMFEEALEPGFSSGL